jgi:uncharacterized repeat protein (TIGR03806 family)
MLLSQTGCVNPANPTQPASSLVPYDVNSPLWSDGAKKERYIFLPAGKKIHVKDCMADPASCVGLQDGGTAEDEGHWDLPNGTVLVKTFIVGGKRIETRLLMHMNDGSWLGFSYEWNDNETEATLLPDEKDKPVGTQTWHYPGRAQCLQCHTAEAGRSLGPSTPQMNRDYPYATGSMNQIDAMVARGMFDATPRKLSAYPTPTVTTTGTLTQRARSYLQTNCAICHRPGGALSDVDLRFVTAMADTRLCNQPIQKGTGDPLLPQVRLVPGQPAQSSLSFRMHDTSHQPASVSQTIYRMPRIGSLMVDPEGTKIVDDWITAMMPDCQ